MRFKPKSTAALQLALGGLPGTMPVHVDQDIAVSANTVRELRRVTAWPANAAVTTPLGHGPEAAVRVSKVSATRVTPKP